VFVFPNISRECGALEHQETVIQQRDRTPESSKKLLWKLQNLTNETQL